MRTRTQSLLVVAALLGAGPAPGHGQHAAIDPRWLAYLGCWEPVYATTSRVCVVPAAAISAVDLVTIVNGQVTARERIVATGQRLETSLGDCATRRSAEWSAHGQRLYLRSEDVCSGGTTRGGTGLIAMSGNGEWLYVQGMTLGGQTGLRVQRYRETTSDIPLPNDVADALRLSVSTAMQARAAAGAPLSIDDVVEASRRVDAPVLEAWLVERAEPFTLDAKRLIVLADAGVPPRVIDLMIALSYPKIFAINAASREGERRVAPDSSHSGAGPVSAMAPIEPLCSTLYVMDPYASYDCTGLGGGYGYGYGWYPDGYPVTIVYVASGGGSSPRPHGRVVNGEGYTQAPSTGTAGALPRTSEPSSPAPSGSLSGSAPPSRSTSSSTEQRTAKPRPPQ